MPEQRSTFIGQFYWFVWLFVLLFFIAACGISPTESSLIGTWKSSTTGATFVFKQDKTYTFDQPGAQRISGRFHALGNPATLADAQFDLGTLGIRFLPAGDAFYLYVDGAGGSELFSRAAQDEGMHETSVSDERTRIRA